MTTQVLYNKVRLWDVDHPPKGSGASIRNIEKIDAGAIPMILRMASRGLQIDPTHFENVSVLLKQDMDKLTEDVKKLTGHYVNIDSGDQVADLLFKKLKIKQIRPKMTTSGDRESVEDEVLKAIQHEHPVVPLIQLYKQYSKLDGTYASVIPKLAIKTAEGKRRIRFNVGSTRIPSGRLNSREPNLLAMPNRSKRARQMMEGFITDPGWCFLSVDESQIEPRLAAHLSGDSNLCRIYDNDEDIYSDYATAAFKLKDERWECQGFGSAGVHEGSLCKNQEHLGHGWHYPTVDKKEHRFPAKTCILAWIYDVSAKGLLEQMPIVCGSCLKPATEHDCNNFYSHWNEDNCQDLINAANVTYPGVLRDRFKNHAIARKYGYIWDMWGRILHVTAKFSALPWIVSAGLREVCNFPYQSGAQGTIKLTMAAVDDDMQYLKWYQHQLCHPLLQIHDELLFEVREDMAEEIGEHVKWRFETCCKLRVPIKAGALTAPVWGLMAK